MSNQRDQETEIELPPLQLTDDEYRAEVKRRVGQQDPRLMEQRLGDLALLCPRTIGKHGDIDTSEKLAELLASLPSTFPIQAWDSEGLIKVGEIHLEWRSLFNTLASMRDESIRVHMGKGWNEVQARDMAGVVLMGQIEFIVAASSLAMSEDFGFFLQEAQHSGADTFRALCGLPLLPHNSLYKELSQAHEHSMRRRSRKARTTRSRRTGWLTWQEFEIAITAWPSETPPPLGEFAASLPRYAAETPLTNPVERQKDRTRARSAMKKELAQLQREGFCPETNWPKLFEGVRNEQYPRYDPFHVNVDVDAGDESH